MENLKVGQSFEVVEVLSDGWFGKTFKIGGHTIKSLGNDWNHTLANGIEWECSDEKKRLEFQSRFMVN